MLTDRERFAAILGAQPLRQADAIVVLCGEDAEGRRDAAVELMRNQAAPVIVCAGDKHEPPRWVGAESIAQAIVGLGVAPDRVMITAASNTREQAVRVTELAVANDWHQLLIVASPYHMPRAFLTFLQALIEAERDDTIRLIPYACRHLPWFAAPPGVDVPRATLLETEAEKCEQYGPHVAPYAIGVANLQFWEHRAPA